MKKKVVLFYCDRCMREEQERPAATAVWIRVAGISGARRLDVCAEHLEMILGAPASSNGASAPVAVSMPDHAAKGFGKRSRVYADRAQKILALAEKRPRFSIDQALEVCGEKRTTLVGVVIRHLIGQRKLEVVMQGVYQRPGYQMPAPPSLEAAAEAAAKYVKAQPGIRTSYLPPLLGMERKQWKPTLAILREKSLVRTKGTKSAMRVYPRT